MIPYNLARINNDFIKIFEDIDDNIVFKIEEEIAQKDDHPIYGERNKHIDILNIQNINKQVNTIIEYNKDKENSNAVQLMNLSKCCDGIYLRILEDNSVIIDVFELKDTISDQTWYGKKKLKNGTMKGSAKEQLEAGVLIALCLLTISGLTNIIEINCNLAYSFEAKKITTISRKPMVGKQVKPWNSKTIELFSGDENRVSKKKINMRSIILKPTDETKCIYMESVNF